jgi:predicted phage terminase large subunit-like protein
MLLHKDLEKLARIELARRELLSRDLLEFTMEMQPGYIPGWVHRDICYRLERFSRDVIAQKSPRLMLLVPPRHGKSLLASQMFPCHHLGHRPQHEIINIGYNLELPTLFSRRVREVLSSKEYASIFPETQLNPKSQSVEAWLTTRKGGFTAAGVGGGITGKGAHVLIVDDPIKNMEEADNFNTREKLEDWFFAAAYTRLAPGGGVLIIETMWHDDDLAGRLMSKMEYQDLADQYEIIRYPAISEQYEYRHRDTYEIQRSDIPIELKDAPRLELLRKPNEPLHADRYSLEYLERVRAQDNNGRIWSALYQQNPVPREGLFFKEGSFHYAPSAPSKEHRRLYMAWDFAISQKQRADYTVGVTLMQDESDNLYLVDMVRFRGDAKRIGDEFTAMIARWSNITGSSLKLGIEDGQIWKALKPMLKERMRAEGCYVSIETLKALTDKESRAQTLQGRMEHRRFWFIEASPWMKDVQQELSRFPAGRHDDIVDALAWATLLATGKKPKQLPIARNQLRSWKDKLNKLGKTGGGGHMSA